MTILVDAQHLAVDLGWSILPVKPHGKTPLTPHGVLDASTDPDVISRWADRWPDMNIGIATGSPGPQVLDIDQPKRAAALLTTLQAAGGPEVATSRGRHLYFAGTDKGTINVGFGELRGRGSYVVCPPSVHPDGKAYVWLVQPNGAVLPAIPDALSTNVDKAGTAGTGTMPVRHRVGHGQRHDHLKDLAVRYVRSGMTDPAAIERALKAEYEAVCDQDPPAKPSEFADLAKWATSTRIADRERASAIALTAGDDQAAQPAAIINAANVKSVALRWAWEGRLLLSYLVVQTGIEGLGKSVFAAWMIAKLTRGELNGELNDTPTSVLIVAGEDGITDTWRPRLKVANANLDRVAFLALDQLPDDWNIRDGLDALTTAVTETDARVVFVDALLDHMPPAKAGESVNSPTFTRNALKPLRRFAREQNVAVLFSMHPPKGKAAGFRDLVQASQAFGAIPRIGLLLAYHPDDAQLPKQQRRRVIVRGKGNVGVDPGALEFRVVGVKHLHDDGRTADIPNVVDVKSSPLTIDAILAADNTSDRPSGKHDQAESMIVALLADGQWHESKPILAALAAAGVSYSTARRATTTLGVEIRKQPGITDGPWEWRNKLAAPQTEETNIEEPTGVGFFDRLARAGGLSLDGDFDQNPPKNGLDKTRTQEPIDFQMASSKQAKKAKNPSAEKPPARAREAPIDPTAGEEQIVQQFIDEFDAVEINPPGAES